MDILGVRVDEVDGTRALEKVASFLDSQKQNKIFTPNPEMLVDARNDEYFREVLNSGDLNICDGFGLWLAAKLSLRGSRDPSPPLGTGSAIQSPAVRISGVDFMLDICGLAKEKDKGVSLLGSGDESVIKNAAEALKRKFSGLKICGFNNGIKIEKLVNHKIEYDKTGNEDLLYDIIMQAPDILFVGFGHGKQEKWIYENLAQLPSVKVAIGVGGAFDFLAGKSKRAPKFMRWLGLEWLWRLSLEPWRIKRIFKATIVFLFYFLWQPTAR
ncbi:MAG: WecB/TagA/CpsF family glycosyltransferase [Candidatus Magasanikbacteria bacterium]|nr:WecB/TagA/CpsF family glycosyltransferase [Candidatus Magasanikbacteria bacterium]